MSRGCLDVALTVALTTICVSLPVISGFNLDTRHPIILTDNSQGRSYFGFSVGLLTNSAGSRILVGAPRANSSTTLEPGVIFSCSPGTQNCQEIPFQTQITERDHRDEYKYREVTANGWLGVSLDVSNTPRPYVVACSHLWKNARYAGNWLTNGMCYTVNHELNIGSVRRLLPLTRRSKQSDGDTTYVYGFGMAGFSSHFLEDTDDLVLGAPGVLNWKGTLIYSEEPEYNRPKVNQRYHIPYPRTQFSQDAYLGYSVSSGAFYNVHEKQLVAGSPREGPAGSVYIVEIPTTDDDGLIVRNKLEGNQMGEYFGGSVCAVDVNGDHLSDLLVGAPLHSIHQDEGIVYLYMSSQEGRLSLSSKNLVGSSQPKARFGTAISSIGDIDKDGFNDVAIGAPYEEENGAVHIYRGSTKGLIKAQKILAADIDQNLRGFGISISKGLDIDRNLYSDIAVGAHESGQTVVLRSFPVVKLQTSMTFNITQINLNNPNCQYQGKTTACFSVTTCVAYSGLNLPNRLDVKNILAIESSEHMERRAFFAVASGSENTITDNITLTKEAPNCKSFTAHVLSTTEDLLTPLQFSLKSQPRINPHSEKNFCKDCPVLSNEESTLKESLSFVKNCGSDEVCDSDLETKVTVLGLSEDVPYVLGSASTLTLMAEIINKGPDPAYLSRAFIILPERTSVNKFDNLCYKSEESSNGDVTCDLGNPINPGSKIQLQIIIDVNEVKISVERLHFSVNVSTISIDGNTENDNVGLVIPVRTDADISLVGRTDNEQYLLIKDETRNESVVFTIHHIFQVLKSGYSPIDSVTLEIMVPSSKENYINILSVEPRINGKPSQFGTCTGNFLSSTTTQHPDDTSNLSESAQSTLKTSIDENQLILDCSTMSCVTIQCRLGPFVEQEVASVTVSMKILLNALRNLIRDKENIRLVSWGRVEINDPGIQQPPDEAKIITEFFKEGPPKSKELDSWIIPVCIIAGILLLLLIALILAKCGFFRRKEKEELEKLTGPEKDEALLNQNDEGYGAATNTTD